MVLLRCLLVGISLQIAWGQSDHNTDAVQAETAALAALIELTDPLAGQDHIKEEVRDLVLQLGDRSFADRQAATLALAKMNPAIIGILQSEPTGNDPEVEIRIKQVIAVLKRTTGNLGRTINEAVDILLEKENKEVVSLLLELMENSDQQVRYYAAYGIRRATGKTFEFDPHAGYELRKTQVAAWKKWWRDAEPGFAFAKLKKSDREIGIIIANDAGKQVILLDMKGKVLWQRQLKVTPKSVTILPNGHYLVAHDTGACEFDRKNKMVWDNSSAGLGQKMTYDIQRLENGNTLVCYVSDGHVSELTRDGKIAWQMEGLKSPGAAYRLPNGNTLISENHANRVIEVDRAKNTLWKSGPLKNPSDATMLHNGNVLVAEWGSNRAFEIDRAETITWSFKSKGNVSSAQRLADGTTLVAQAGSLVITDHHGNLVREIYKCDRKYGKVKLVQIPLILPEHE